MLAGDLYRGTIENWISIIGFDVSLFNVFQMNIIFLTNHEAHTIPSGIHTLAWLKITGEGSYPNNF